MVRFLSSFIIISFSFVGFLQASENLSLVEKEFHYKDTSLKAQVPNEFDKALFEKRARYSIEERYKDKSPTDIEKRFTTLLANSLVMTFEESIEEENQERALAYLMACVTNKSLHFPQDLYYTLIETNPDMVFILKELNEIPEEFLRKKLEKIVNILIHQSKIIKDIHFSDGEDDPFVISALKENSEKDYCLESQSSSIKGEECTKIKEPRKINKSRKTPQSKRKKRR